LSGAGIGKQCAGTRYDYREEQVLASNALAQDMTIERSGEGSTILLASRTMLGECCLAAIQPKGFWTKLRAQERESVCV